MSSNRSHRALRGAVAAGLLACGAAVAHAEQMMPERFALLEQPQIASVCAAAMNARGDQAVRNEDAMDSERLTALQQYMFARRVWMLDAHLDDASLERWARSFDSQSAAERSVQSSYCFDAAVARVDAMPEHEVWRLRADGYGAAQTMWTRHRAATRAEGPSASAITPGG